MEISDPKQMTIQILDDNGNVMRSQQFKTRSEILEIKRKLHAKDFFDQVTQQADYLVGDPEVMTAEFYGWDGEHQYTIEYENPCELLQDISIMITSFHQGIEEHRNELIKEKGAKRSPFK